MVNQKSRERFVPLIHVLHFFTSIYKAYIIKKIDNVTLDPISHQQLHLDVTQSQEFQSGWHSGEALTSHKCSLHSKRFQWARSDLFFRPRENRASAKKNGGGRGGEER